MQEYADRFRAVHVAVIGDLILDCYLYGSVDRISPEAPVPVIRAASEKSVAGGAANVAANLASLGLHVHVVGVSGNDDARNELIACLAAAGVTDSSGIVASAQRRTTKKLRIVGAKQQIVRIDHEDTAECDGESERACVGAAEKAIDAADIVILSDYGKGLLSEGLIAAVIGYAGKKSKRVLVDPKRRDFEAYRGASLLTPNRKELADATGMPCETDAQAAAAAAKAQQSCNADILLTRSEKGMSFFPLHGSPVHMATVAQDVFDVSGAGDTVVATLAAALGAEAPIVDAMRMANHAAGIVVSKLGTATVSVDELLSSMAATDNDDTADGELMELDALVARRKSWERARLTVGITNGCFDLLHPGHVALIRQAAASCDRLVVALNSDKSVKRLKGAGRPVQDERARATVAGGIKGVAAVVLFSEDTPLELIQALEPDVLVKGADYEEADIVGADIVRARGGQVIRVALEAGHSTSNLVAASARNAAM